MESSALSQVADAGNMDRIDEELKEIEEEQASKNAEILKKGQKEVA